MLTGSDFRALGFTLEGEYYVFGSLSIWICEDEDCSDQYFYGQDKVRSREQLEELIKNNL